MQVLSHTARFEGLKTLTFISQSADASNGYMSATTLATCVKQAKAKSWNGGLMFWEFPDIVSYFIPLFLRSKLRHAPPGVRVRENSARTLWLLNGLQADPEQAWGS